METKQTKTFTNKDKFNLPTAIKLSEVVDKEPIDVVGAMIIDRPDKDGVFTTNGFLKAADGSIYGTISVPVIQSIDALIDIIDETGESCAVRVISKKSNQNRDYLLLQLA